jgi:peptide/nickel transport system permease protein
MAQAVTAAGPLGREMTGSPEMQTVLRWLSFCGRRVLSLAVIAAVLVVATFFLVRLVPGDPAVRLLGEDATPEVLAGIREELGLDRPLLAQLGSYGAGVVRGDLGDSLVGDFAVADIIGQRLPRTIALAATGTAIVLLGALVGGLWAGVLAATGRRRGVDVAFTFGTGIFGAIPEYVFATLLVVVFGLWLEVLPVAGSDGVKSLILPAAAVSLRPMSTLSRIVRLETVEVFSQDYVRSARGKRVSTGRLVVRHVVPNVLTSALTMGGVILGSLLGGAVVVETVFAWPGSARRSSMRCGPTTTPPCRASCWCSASRWSS